MTEIKTWGDRLAEIPDGTITTNYHVTSAMQEEIDELRAALAKQGEPVAWQYRTRPDWEKDWQQGWMYCSKGAFEDYTRAPLLHDWHYEVRELFTHPVRHMSDEPVLGTKTWMEGGVVMTQNLTASDIYKPVPMTEDEFITAVEASGIEVDNVDAEFAIKRIVELFHGIKGATE